MTKQSGYATKQTGYFWTKQLGLNNMNLKDGGSVRYKALVYEVTKIHRLAPEVDGVKPYIDGFEIKILGMTVYRETNE